jgi:hypothetical protein
MKRLSLFLAALILTAQPQKQITWTVLSAAGTTSSIAVAGSDVHTVQIVVTGGPGACTLNLDGSLDAIHWADISGGQTCTSNVVFHVVNRSVAFVRGNLTAFSGGTAPTATVTYLGHSTGGRP